MLYIKTVLSGNRWEVFDTSDNTSEIVSYSDLKYCAKLGVNIKGLSFNNGALNISVYSPETPTDVRLLNLALMSGVNLVIDNGSLKGITVSKNLTSDVTLVLSEYCHTLCTGCLDNLVSISSGYKLTLVIDNNLSLCSGTLRHNYMLPDGIELDITRYTERKGIISLYSTLSFSMIRDNVKDYPERHLAGMLIYIFKESTPKNLKDHIAKYSPDLRNSAIDLLVGYYKHAFNSLLIDIPSNACLGQYYNAGLRNHMDSYESYIKSGNFDINLVSSDLDSYSDLLSKVFKHLKLRNHKFLSCFCNLTPFYSGKYAKDILVMYMKFLVNLRKLWI